MLGQISDPSKGDPDIIVKKYGQLQNKSQQIIKVLDKFGTGMIATLDSVDFTELNDRVAAMGRSAMMFPEYTGSNRAKVVSIWPKYKNSYHIQECIIICSALTLWKTHLASSENLSDVWIKQLPMGTPVLHCGGIDLLMLWSDPNIRPEMKTYVMILLNILYSTSKELYDIYMQPDIDIDQFVNSVHDMLDMFENRPQLSRCKRAFKILKNSIGDLRTNFPEYYKDYVQTSNSNIIVENFIGDISQKNNSSASVTAEFMRIIRYIQSASNNSFDIAGDMKKVMGQAGKKAGVSDEFEKMLNTNEYNEPIKLVNAEYDTVLSQIWESRSALGLTSELYAQLSKDPVRLAGTAKMLGYTITTPEFVKSLADATADESDDDSCCSNDDSHQHCDVESVTGELDNVNLTADSDKTGSADVAGASAAGDDNADNGSDSDDSDDSDDSNGGSGSDSGESGEYLFGIKLTDESYEAVKAKADNPTIPYAIRTFAQNKLLKFELSREQS